MQSKNTYEQSRRSVLSDCCGRWGHAKSSHIIVHHCLPVRSTWVILWRVDRVDSAFVVCAAALQQPIEMYNCIRVQCTCIMAGFRICRRTLVAYIQPVESWGGVQSAAAAMATYRVVQNRTPGSRNLLKRAASLQQRRRRLFTGVRQRSKHIMSSFTASAGLK